jgi:hypothetical protein
MGRSIDADGQSADDGQAMADQGFGEPLGICQTLLAGSPGPHQPDGWFVQKVCIAQEIESLNGWRGLLGEAWQLVFVDRDNLEGLWGGKTWHGRGKQRQ